MNDASHESKAPTRFLVVGPQRSGTSVTHIALAGHPATSMIPGEVLVQPFFTEGMAAFTTGDESYQERRTGFGSLFDGLARVPFDTRRGGAAEPTALGMKVAFRGRDDAADLANSIREFFDGMRVIRVVREDLVAQYGSLLLAQKTGKWHAWKGERGSSETPTIRIDPKEFLAYAEDVRRGLAQLELLSDTHDVLDFVYERDIAGEPAFERLFGFLGIGALPPSWVNMRKAAPPPESFISNYDKLRARLAALPPLDLDGERQHAAARLSEWESRQRPYYHASRATYSLDHGQFSEAFRRALTALEAFDQLRPVMVGRLFEILETTCERSQDVDAAEVALDRLHPRYGQTAPCMVLAARVDVARGRNDQARARLEEALRIAPDLKRASSLRENLAGGT